MILNLAAQSNPPATQPTRCIPSTPEHPEITTLLGERHLWLSAFFCNLFAFMCMRTVCDGMSMDGMRPGEHVSTEICQLRQTRAT